MSLKGNTFGTPNEASACAERQERVSSISPCLHNFHGILYGASPAMKKVIEQIERVAATSASVLITGESGTGKEMAAQAIQSLSERHDKPFLAVNCGAISPNLIESELFGHDKGSFTGAIRDHRGYFERVDGGTLLLDEITEMPVALQVKLLRVLETGLFSRVGSTRPQKVDVRIITASNRDPAVAVSQGDLRKDLLYRIQVFPIHLPALRERHEDLELLIRHFLEELNHKERRAKGISEAALEKLCRYPWPGNFRQLKNIIYQAFLMADQNIEVKDLAAEITETPEHVGGPSIRVEVGRSLAEMEKKLVLATLDHCGGKREAAAHMLGVSVKTLYHRLRDYRRDARRSDARRSDARHEEDRPGSFSGGLD